MSLNLTENQSRLIAYIAIGILFLLIVVGMLQQIASAAAYRKAMLSIANAAKNGDNLTFQVANFFPKNGTESDS